ncbi:hypothetical protein ACXZ65_17340 [Streptomyces aculeolatus]
MRRSRRRTAAQQEALRDQYKRQVGPLRLFLLLECAPLTVDPLEIADEAFERAFTQPERSFTYCEIRKIAEEIVHERKKSGRAREYAQYKLEKIFDPYLTDDLEPVRRVLRAIDELSLHQRRAVEASLIHLLTTDGLTETVGGSASTRRVQKAEGLAKLAKADVNLDLLAPFFAQMGRNAHDDLDEAPAR